ncbi:MAG: tetratricopeptide repeat protein [bacterium]|nr:tetratricopeptide repeat protein [bacterium]
MTPSVALIVALAVLAEGGEQELVAARLSAGRALLQEQRCEEAARLFKEVLELDPMNGTALFNLGYIYGDCLPDEELREKYWSLYRASAHLSLGDVALSGGELQEAAAHYQDAMAHLPASGALHERLGALYRKMGLGREALREYEAAAALQPENAGLQEELARHFYAAGDIAKAAAYAARAADARSGDASLRRIAMDLFARAGEGERAAGQLAALAASGGATPDEHCALAEYRIGRGMLEEAADAIRAGWSEGTRERCAAAALALARAHEERGDAAAAAAVYGVMAEAGAVGPDIFNALAVALQRSGRLDAAAAAGERGVSLFPEDAALRNNLGTIYALRAEYERAVEEYRRAVEIRPDFAEAYLDMGIVYGDYLKDRPKAVEAFERYVALRPEGRSLPEVSRLLGPAPAARIPAGGDEGGVPPAGPTPETPTPTPRARIMRF